MLHTRRNWLKTSLLTAAVTSCRPLSRRAEYHGAGRNGKLGSSMLKLSVSGQCRSFDDD